MTLVFVVLPFVVHDDIVIVISLTEPRGASLRAMVVYVYSHVAQGVVFRVQLVEGGQRFSAGIVCDGRFGEYTNRYGTTDYNAHPRERVQKVSLYALLSVQIQSVHPTRRAEIEQRQDREEKTQLFVS
jgi:hypothetical protein